MCPQLTPASSSHIWFSTHGPFPEGIPNKFFVLGRRGNLYFCLWGTCARARTHTRIHTTQCEEEIWHVPLLPVLIVRAVRWGAEYVLYLGVDTPDGVSESCSSPSTIFGIPGVRLCLALSSRTGHGLKAILYLKQPEAYVSLIVAKANASFLCECSKWQIQVGCSAQGVRRSCGFLCLCFCASAELCVCEISAGWTVKLEAQRSDKEQCKRIQKGFGSFS